MRPHRSWSRYRTRHVPTARVLVATGSGLAPLHDGRLRLAVTVVTLLALALLTLATPTRGESLPVDPATVGDGRIEIETYFLEIANPDPEISNRAFDAIEALWHPGFVVMAVEVLRFIPQDRRQRLLRIVRARSGKDFGMDFDQWYDWIWSQEPNDPPRYAEFKALLYGLIDRKFVGYFSSERASTIRLDEVRWGGVVQDGIPPLRGPEMITAAQARYLQDDNVVFGLEIEGDARAYPKRILAWHEMFVDTVGGVPVAGVYCTLCGSMILYETRHDGVDHALGTSGFLYRSNKLMFDQATQSLWNTLWGRPVIGPLVGQDIELEVRSVVTTTWGEWRRRHPDTTVLSLNTGHDRDYGEGVAYQDYFSTDEVMFTVPELDRRLKNKAEVLIVEPRAAGDEPLALASKFLRKNKLHHDRQGELEFVVLTDGSGAHRAYATDGLSFKRWDGSAVATDSEGGRWTLSEQALSHEDGRTLRRLSAHRAFWFGWYAANPNTRLVK